MRTGGNDREVLAYEPVKWILRARGKNQRDSTKLLAFEDDEGHFVDGDSGIENRAVDLGILLSWAR
jgi:protease II